MNPDFDLGDVERDGRRGRPRPSALGLRAVVDAMPCDCGRNVVKLAELSRRTGIHVVAPTGLHHERYYGPTTGASAMPVEAIAELFTLDVTDGIDADDYAGRTSAGPASGRGHQGRRAARAARRPATARIFEAAAATHRRDRRADPDPLRGRHRGARAGPRAGRPRGRAVARRAEPRRQGRRPRLPPGAARRPARSPSTTARSAGATPTNGTLQLLEWALEDGHIGGILLGMDAARQGYYHAYGGSPGLAWLLDGFAAQMRAAASTTTSSSGCSSTTRHARSRSPRPPRTRPRDRTHPSVRPARRPAHERGRLARAAVVVRGRDRGRRARRVRTGRPGRDARRRGRPRDPRPGARPASTSSATARCAGPASSPPSSTAT